VSSRVYDNTKIVGEQQQEAIAALQRRVDQIATMQIEEIDRHHSTIVVRPIEPAPEPASQLGRDSSETTTGLGLEISTTTATSSELETRSMSPLGDVPPPRGAELERRFSAGNRAFEERALAVSILRELLDMADVSRHCGESVVTPKMPFPM
jgi:hypothetical protein